MSRFSDGPPCGKETLLPSVSDPCNVEILLPLLSQGNNGVAPWEELPACIQEKKIEIRYSRLRES